MADEDDIWEESPEGEPKLHCPHLLLCRSIWFDASRPERGFSLGGVRTALAPSDRRQFPFGVERLFAYAQLWGEPGEYHLRIRVVRIKVDEYDEVVEVELGADEEPLEFRTPNNRPYEITGLNYVEEFALAVGPLVFPVPGVYEFQLWANDDEFPVARERVHVREG